MKSLFAFSNLHFIPGVLTHYSNVGRVAHRIFQVLSSLGECHYIDQGESPEGQTYDVFVGHTTNLPTVLQKNNVRRVLAFLTGPNPVNMNLCDAALLMGNKTVLKMLEAVKKEKVRLTNVGAAMSHYDKLPETSRSDSFVYFTSDIRHQKGADVVLGVWRLQKACLHVIGDYLSAEHYKAKFAAINNGNVFDHGHLANNSDAFRTIVQSAKFACMPMTYEGQCGALLELIHNGLLPVTTLESGVDERILDYCFIAPPHNIPETTRLVNAALEISEKEYRDRVAGMFNTFRQLNDWSLFDKNLIDALNEIGATA